MTQKEWELETRIKQLEGSDLESIINGFNKKIDSIVNKAVFKLDSLKLEFKLRDNTQKKKKILESHMMWQKLIDDQARLAMGGQCNIHQGFGLLNRLGETQRLGQQSGCGQAHYSNNLTGIGSLLIDRVF